MPRTAKEIIDQADELAARFESYDPQRAEIKDAASLRAVRQAFQARADAERELAEAVAAARAQGHSWAAIGAMVGTSGEAARQRYGQSSTGRAPAPNDAEPDFIGIGHTGRGELSERAKELRQAEFGS